MTPSHQQDPLLLPSWPGKPANQRDHSPNIVVPFPDSHAASPLCCPVAKHGNGENLLGRRTEESVVCVQHTYGQLLVAARHASDFQLLLECNGGTEI